MKQKIIGIVNKYWFPATVSLALVIFQALAYFLAKFTPIEAHLVGNSIDKAIPFIPIFIIPYVLWYLFLIVVPCILYHQDRKMFYWYLVANFLIDTVATLIFIFYPTLLIRPELHIDSIFTWLLNLIYVGDTPALNCFPSIHCASCFVAIFIMIKGNKIKNKYRFMTSIFALFIIASTLFIKQHVVIDVVGAFVVALLMVILVKATSLHTYIEKIIERKR